MELAWNLLWLNNLADDSLSYSEISRWRRLETLKFQMGFTSYRSNLREHALDMCIIARGLGWRSYMLGEFTRMGKIEKR